MNVKSLLGELRMRGVTLWPDGDQIRIKGTGEPLSPELLADLKSYKPEIMQALKEEQPQPYLNQQGDLVISFDSDPRYRWWHPGGMKLSENFPLS